MKTVTFTEEQLTKAILDAAFDRADEFSKENDDGSKFMLFIMLAGTAIAKGVA